MEDYLKTIYMILQEYGRASTKQIAERMRIAPASVTGMLKKMAEDINPPLVAYQKHRGVVLTADGEAAALETIRNHRLIELYLQKVLGYSWDEVHHEADRLEHFISRELADRMARAMGDPTRDPHGEPIPSREFDLPPQSDLRLSDLRPGDQGIVQRVESTNPDLLRHLADLGLIPEEEITVIDHSSYDGNVSLRVGRRTEVIVLGTQITRSIFIEQE
jgi:DtxR family transcriptional regulator, Mn-dependent transcriptional regulator